jgi:Ca-activated chloride channel family protein
MSGLGLDVGFPAALYALGLVPLFGLLALKSRYALGPRRRAMATAARALSVVLTVLALADLRFGWSTERLAVAAVIDGSEGIAPEERARVAGELTALAASRSDVVFRLPPSGPLAGAPDAATELGARLALLPTDRVRRVLVATDGRDPEHRLASAIERARAAGAEVSLLPIGAGPVLDELSLARLDVPRLVRAEETQDVAVTLWAARDVEVPLEVFLDGRSVARARHTARAGDSTARIAVRFPIEPGVHELEVAAGLPSAVTVNDRWRSLVEVLPKPRVRIYRPAGEEPLLAAVLRDAGMEVEVAPPSAAFASAAEYDPFALVITDEVELNDLGGAAEEALRAWIEDEGGGWIDVTGSRPVRSTPRPLRRLQPIGPPPAPPEPRPLELVIVIDHSSSMGGGPMASARSAAVAAVNSVLQRPDSLVGMVAFSEVADITMAPVPVSGAQQLVNRIRQIEANGGTNIAAAIQAANRIMSRDPRYIHHVVLISDGESDPPAAIAAAVSLAGRGVSLSCITIGPPSPLLAEIARVGRGRYHSTNAGGALTSLVLSEANFRTPPAARNTTFRPREVSHLSMFDGVAFSDAPSITGHALSTLRPGASEALAATEGMPLLAHWHRGLGQVASFTSTVNGAWVDQFRLWDGFRPFWTAFARGMLRTRPIEPPRIHLEPNPLDPDRRIVTVVSPFVASDVEPVVRLFRGRGEPSPLAVIARGPGIFQAEVPVGFTMLVDARLPLDPEPTAAAGDERPYAPDLTRFGPDLPALARMAELGGGALRSAPDEVLAAGGEAWVMQPLRIPLLLGALLTYLLSLLLLRLPDPTLTTVSAEAPGRSSVVPTTRLSRPPSTPSPRPRSKEAA